MDIRNCKKCGKIYSYDGFNLCHSCRQENEKDFDRVKEYIYEHPGANISEVHDATEVEVERIIEYLREGRLEIAEGGNLILECESCGKSITTGRYCDECAGNLHRELGGAIKGTKDQKKKSSQEKAQFRYMDRSKDRR